MAGHSEILAEPQFDFIADLFVRTGIFVSHCEDTDMDEHSENLEKMNLARALSRISASAKFPVLAALAAEASKRIDMQHSDSEESLSHDLHQAVSIFLQMGDPKISLEYRKAVMYVATSVARAYREELDHHDEEFLLETFMNKISGFLNKTANYEEFKNMNISPAEDSAITAISEALKI